MFRTLFITLTLSAASAATAQECEGLGLKSTYLTQQFCAQILDLIPSDTTRSMKDDPTPKPGAPKLPDWADIQVLQDAYRADPRKTLDLIKRIKSAGGLPET